MYSTTKQPETEVIFPSWHFDHWRAVDDRVRGGSSISHLDKVQLDHSDEDVYEDLEKGEKSHRIAARFWGNLDIDTLGGAGFASQSYRYGPSPLKLSKIDFDGILIKYQLDFNKTKDDNNISSEAEAESTKPKRFTFVLKTTPTSHIPKHPKIPNKPREAQLTYEVQFDLPHQTSSVSSTSSSEASFKWQDFRAVYRGKTIPEGDEKWVPLDTNLIYELSLMCRSDFGKQKGDFGVIINSIEAIKKKQTPTGNGFWDSITTMWSNLRDWVTNLFNWSSSGKIKLDDVGDEEKRLIA
ncbi:uncharacterized protein L201_000916 [Kwoniella dendrophila CBS 6074]|uniref:NADH:ubiquinone oxidoreductase intermediate-associated protein 30 domain-containing protein n=1 Tax=Kwoniella dendrophila CBS 6074 TaxID=1295534 RepID=A0AAX4JNC6_9TREE